MSVWRYSRAEGVYTPPGSGRRAPDAGGRDCNPRQRHRSGPVTVESCSLAWRFGGLFFKRQVDAFMATILLRMARLDVFDAES
mgnify:CR=1 FL=1